MGSIHNRLFGCGAGSCRDIHSHFFDRQVQVNQLCHFFHLKHQLQPIQILPLRSHQRKHQPLHQAKPPLRR